MSARGLCGMISHCVYGFVYARILEALELLIRIRAYL